MKMNKQQALKKIYELKQFVKNLYTKENRYAKVQRSDEKSGLLQDEDGQHLIQCFSIDVDINYIIDDNEKLFFHCWISGDRRPFEITDNQGNVLFESNKECNVRFLKEAEE